MRRFRSKKTRPSGGACTDGGVEHQVLRRNVAPVLSSTGWADWFNVAQQRLEFVSFECVGVWMVPFKQRIGSARFFTAKALRHEI